MARCDGRSAVRLPEWTDRSLGARVASQPRCVQIANWVFFHSHIARTSNMFLPLSSLVVLLMVSIDVARPQMRPMPWETWDVRASDSILRRRVMGLDQSRPSNAWPGGALPHLGR